MGSARDDVRAREGRDASGMLEAMTDRVNQQEPPIEVISGGEPLLGLGDVRIDLQLAFSQAAEGCIRQLAIKREVPCATCRGSGRIGTDTECVWCGGRGEREYSWDGPTTCEHCHGF